MSKLRPIPGETAFGEVLFIDTEDPRFRDHNNVCNRCDNPLWMHEREKVFPDDGPTGSWHHELRCP